MKKSYFICLFFTFLTISPALFAAEESWREYKLQQGVTVYFPLSWEIYIPTYDIETDVPNFRWELLASSSYDLKIVATVALPPKMKVETPEDVSTWFPDKNKNRERKWSQIADFATHAQYERRKDPKLFPRLSFSSIKEKGRWARISTYKTPFLFEGALAYQKEIRLLNDGRFFSQKDKDILVRMFYPAKSEKIAEEMAIKICNSWSQPYSFWRIISICSMVVVGFIFLKNMSKKTFNLKEIDIDSINISKVNIENSDFIAEERKLNLGEVVIILFLCLTFIGTLTVYSISSDGTSRINSEIFSRCFFRVASEFFILYITSYACSKFLYVRRISIRSMFFCSMAIMLIKETIWGVIIFSALLYFASPFSLIRAAVCISTFLMYRLILRYEYSARTIKTRDAILLFLFSLLSIGAMSIISNIFFHGINIGDKWFFDHIILR